MPGTVGVHENRPSGVISAPGGALVARLKDLLPLTMKGVGGMSNLRASPVPTVRVGKGAWIKGVLVTTMVSGAESRSSGVPVFVAIMVME